MEKVKLTREQAKSLKSYLEYNYDSDYKLEYFIANRNDFTDIYKPLQNIEIDKMARILYQPDSYEVEEEYKVGDWVVYFPDDEVYEVRALLDGEYKGTYQISSGRVTMTKVFTDHLRRATPEEIKAEKERRVWAEIGREVGEFQDGDYGQHTILYYHSKDAIQLKSWYENGSLKGFYPAESFISFGGGE